MEFLQSFLVQNPLMGTLSIVSSVAIICVSLAFILSKNEFSSKLFSIKKKELSDEKAQDIISIEDRLVFLLDELQRNSQDMYDRINTEKREKLENQIQAFNDNFKMFNNSLKEKIFENEKNSDNSYKSLFMYWLDHSCSDKIGKLVISYIKKNNFKSKSSEEIEEIVLNLLSSIQSEFNESLDLAPAFITNASSAKKALNQSMNKLKDHLSDTFFYAKTISEESEKSIIKIKNEFNRKRIDSIKNIFPTVDIKKFIKVDEAGI